jgi:Domain of unknown function (DUF4172)
MSDRLKAIAHEMELAATGLAEFLLECAASCDGEEHFLRESGVLAGSVKHLGPGDQEQLTVEAISTEAVTTSEIEGEILDRASVQSSIRRASAGNWGLRPTKGGLGWLNRGLPRLWISTDLRPRGARYLSHRSQSSPDLAGGRFDSPTPLSQKPPKSVAASPLPFRPAGLV